MGNRIFLPKGNEITNDNRTLIYALGFDTNKYIGKIYPTEMQERIQGNHCDCYGNGEFVLLPKDDPMVKEGMKRYMRCRKCGCYSHL